MASISLILYNCLHLSMSETEDRVQISKEPLARHDIFDNPC